MNTSKRTFNYSIAAYPISWKGYLISPKKICIQFNEVQCKTRAPHSKENLTRTHWGSWEMPVDTEGTSINTLAVGIPLNLYPEILTNILTAINEHSELYPEHSIKDEIQEIINGF